MDNKPNSPELSTDDYNYLCRIVYEQSRIRLGQEKKALVTSRLGKRLRQLQLTGYREYCDLLRSNSGAEELRHLIDRISTNHTQFFREMRHFDVLRDIILPEWRATAASRNEPFRVWSAACSSGEEPYSIAMCLAENLAPSSNNSWIIEASDISGRMIETASRGVYPFDRVAMIDRELLHRYFQKGVNEWEGHVRVQKELRECVHFHQLNLLQRDYPFHQLFHVIFCRNVMIYFDRPTQLNLINRLSDMLMPGGYLLVGHSESLNNTSLSLRLVEPATYLKPLH